jgi:hypothetical protein
VSTGIQANAEEIPVMLTHREIALLLGTTANQIRYIDNLIRKGKEAEAIGRNRVNRLEMQLLHEKLGKYPHQPFAMGKRSASQQPN